MHNTVRKHREALNKGAREVATAVGIDHSQLIRIENESRQASDLVKVKLAQYFGVPITELFFQPDGVLETPETTPA